MDASPDHNDEEVIVAENLAIYGNNRSEDDDSDNESVRSCEIIPVATTNAGSNECILVDGEEVDDVITELNATQEALEIYEIVLLQHRVRGFFRTIGAGLTAVLSGPIAIKHKFSNLFPISSAGRIAVRPLFKRGGYAICSADPCVTRTGLPRSISEPANMTDAYYCEGVSAGIRWFSEMPQN